MHSRRVCRRVLAASAVVVLLGAGGCLVGVAPDDSPPPPPAPLSIELINQTPYVIDANYFISSTAETEAGLFIKENIYTGYSTRVSRTLGPNESASFDLPCERIASMGVRQPVFAAQIGIGGGRSDDEVFLLRDQDYACGATVRFVYFTEGEAFRVRVEFPQ